MHRKLVFTAPHTIPTIRIINRKLFIHPRELYIANILENIKRRGFTVVYNTFDIFDPNFYSNSRFKQKILLGQTHNIDLHGMSDKYNIDVCISTAKKNYNLKKIVEFLESKDLKVMVNYPYNGLSKNGGETITEFLQKNGIKAIQIELSLKMRKRRDIVDLLIKIAELFVEEV